MIDRIFLFGFISPSLSDVSRDSGVLSVFLLNNLLSDTLPGQQVHIHVKRIAHDGTSTSCVSESMAGE